jgi:hypothetical protein
MDDAATPIGQKSARLALICFLVGLLLAVSLLCLAVLRNGEEGVRAIANLGPCTNPWAFFASWVNLGLVTLALTAAIAFGKLTKKTLPAFLVFFTLALLYLSFAREHVHYGDIQDYLGAAKAVATAAPLPPRYVYPPLWAVFLGRIWALGGDPAVKLTCFFTNQFFLVWAIPLFMILLRRITQTTTTAALVTGAVLVVNVPAIRNIVYVQINFLVLFLILASALTSRKRPFLSAALLAVATHLKVFPLFFLPVLIMPWKKRGVLAFMIWMVSIAGILIYLDGSRYFQDFVQNLSAWSPNPFRSSSLTGFISNSLSLAGVSRGGALIAKLLTIPLIALIFKAGRQLWQIQTRELPLEQDQVLVKGLGLLMFLFPLLSPTVWVHHLIVLILPAAILLLHVKTHRDITLFFAAFAAVFLLPVFDWYPWSYIRMAGWIVLLGLYSLIVPRGTVSDWINRFSVCLDSRPSGT